MEYPGRPPLAVDVVRCSWTLLGDSSSHRFTAAREPTEARQQQKRAQPHAAGVERTVLTAGRGPGGGWNGRDGGREGRPGRGPRNGMRRPGRRSWPIRVGRWRSYNPVRVVIIVAAVVPW